MYIWGNRVSRDEGDPGLVLCMKREKEYLRPGFGTTSFFWGGDARNGRCTDVCQVPIVCDLGGRRLLSTRVRGTPPSNSRCGACEAASGLSAWVAGSLGRLVLNDRTGCWEIRLQGFAVWVWRRSSAMGGVVARTGLALRATRAKGTPTPLLSNKD